MDDLLFNLDGHKLHHHLDRLSRFMAGEDISPLYVEFSPVGSCNHRCVFCAYDYIGYQNRRLDPDRTEATLKEMGEMGVKAALFAGEGEPFVHPQMPRFARAARAAGIDVGMFSNCVPLTPKKIEETLPHLTFIRCSFNGGTRQTYAEIHQTKPEDFDKAVANLRNAVAFKRKANLPVTIGMQIVILPQNLKTVPDLARLASDIGVDYLALKPFVQHPDQVTMRWEENFSLADVEPVFQEAEKESRPGFQVVARRESFRKYHHRTYDHCYGLPFFAFILSDGNVYTCGPYYENKEFAYGNIHEASFREIWGSARRKAIQKHAATELDCKKQCMPNCRPDAVNRFLWELKHPPQHVNFI